jgi:hypothetical protein
LSRSKAGSLLHRKSEIAKLLRLPQPIHAAVAFAGKRIKCMACGHHLLADSAPTPEVETGFEASIPEEILDLVAPV